MKTERKIRDEWRDPRFWALVTIGSIVIIIGLVCPPLGVIDNSVLVASGEFIVLAGAIAGIDLHLNIKDLLIKRDKKNEQTEN